MTYSRKTFKIKDMVDMVNEMNQSTSRCDPSELREGWNVFVKGILLETNNYHGYVHAQEAFDPETKEMIDDSRWHFLSTSSQGSRRTQW